VRDNEHFVMSYRDVAVHKMMLQDVVRTEAYERALRELVAPGSQVLDFGCGTGVLSIFASKFGAEKVFAVDRCEFIQFAHEIARANNLSNIEFHHNDSTTLEIGTRVDVLVSEWMGHFLFFEAMLGPLLTVRDKFLKADGIMIPGEVKLHGGLVCDEYFYEDLSFFRNNPYGIDFSPIGESPFWQTKLEFLMEKQILDTTVDLGTFNMHTLKEPPSELVGKVVPTQKATIYGVCGWFTATLAPGITLGTGPGDPPTHWEQMFFPFDEPFEVSPTREVTIKIVLPDDDSQYEPAWRWSISDEKMTIEMNDYDYREQLNPFLPKGLIKP
jgi:protein arginine N-methyltransferase 1